MDSTTPTCPDCKLSLFRYNGQLYCWDCDAWAPTGVIPVRFRGERFCFQPAPKKSVNRPLIHTPGALVSG
jgi:uncharacterized Zn finger protein (UPF0148 family)